MSYDAIYQAVSNELAYLRPQMLTMLEEPQRPSVLYRPELFKEGNQWCAMYGKNAHDAVLGFGDTAAAAMRDFDANWRNERASQPPCAAREGFCELGTREKMECLAEEFTTGCEVTVEQKAFPPGTCLLEVLQAIRRGCRVTGTAQTKEVQR